MKNLIIGLGEVLWDCLPGGKKLGGAPANFAYHVGQLGFDAFAVSAVGNDPLGDEAIALYEHKKLQYIMPRVDFPTGTVDVLVDSHGVPSYNIKQGVAWDNIPLNDEIQRLAQECRAVCWGSLAQRNSISCNTINAFLKGTSKDCLKIFDINLRQNFYSIEILQKSMDCCDILKINDEELVIIEQLFNIHGIDMQNVCWLLMDKFNLKILVLTCGENGSYVFSQNSMSYMDTPKVKVVDTVGAGDSFTGSFVASLLNGKSISEAHRSAVEISAYVCTQDGAMPEIPENLIRQL